MVGVVERDRDTVSQHVGQATSEDVTLATSERRCEAKPSCHWGVTSCPATSINTRCPAGGQLHAGDPEKAHSHAARQEGPLGAQILLNPRFPAHTESTKRKSLGNHQASSSSSYLNQVQSRKTIRSPSILAIHRPTKAA